MIVKKITPGFVIQTYQDGKPVHQEFIAGDDVKYEDEKGETLDPSVNQQVDGTEIYQPFDMVQPRSIWLNGTPMVFIDKQMPFSEGDQLD